MHDSENNRSLICRECGNELPRSLLEGGKDNSSSIYCELCGAENVISHPKLIKDIDEFKYQLMLFNYGKIYEQIKNNDKIMRLIILKKNLKDSHYKKIIKNVCNEILKLSLKEHLGDCLSNLAYEEAENHLQKVKNQLSRTNIALESEFKKSINFIIKIIKGEEEFELMEVDKKKLILHLKDNYGFKVNTKIKNSFSSKLSNRLGQLTYEVLKIYIFNQSKKTLSETNKLEKKAIDNIIKKTIEKFKKEPKIDLTDIQYNKAQKKEFLQLINQFLYQVEFDWIYQQSVQDIVFRIIIALHRVLINQSYIEQLEDFEKNVVEYLKKSNLYESDINFNKPVWKIFTLIFCRIIYVNLNIHRLLKNPDKNQRLNHTIKLEIEEHIMKSITLPKKINYLLLENIPDISLEEFEREYISLKEYLGADYFYRESFCQYIRYLIKLVYRITHSINKEKNLLIHEQDVIKDLASYNFKWKMLRKGCFYHESDLRKGVKRKLLIELKDLSKKFKDSETLYKITERIYTDLTKFYPNLENNDLPSGFRSKIEYLAASLIYYGLRHENYNYLHPEYQNYGVFEYIRNYFPNSNTLKLAISNIIPTIYDFISDSLKSKILYYPKRGHIVDRKIKEKGISLKSKESNNKFIAKIKKYILLLSERIPNPKIIKSISIKMLENTQKTPKIFSYQELIDRNRWFCSPKNIAIAFIFLTHTHRDSKLKSSISITEFSNKYFPDYKDSNYSNVSFIYDYLSDDMKNKITYTPQEFFNHREKINQKKVEDFLNIFIRFFIKDKVELYVKRAFEIYAEAICNGLKEKKIITKNPKYLAASLAYYSILEYSGGKVYKKDFINRLKQNGFYLQNVFYKVMKQLEQFIEIEHKVVIFDEEKFKEALFRIKSHHESIDRIDNVILIDLILQTIIFYKDRFKEFVKALNFISKNGKASRLLEKLENPNIFNKESSLMLFISQYGELIERLRIIEEKKQQLKKFLKQFEDERRKYYKYTDRKAKKRLREKERYISYKHYFFSHKLRIKRFLLMLGFSPFDGFDLWENRVVIEEKHKIYANFHHFHYKPEGKSEKDLVFIPIKPPKKYRKGEYLTKKYLTHNMISGLEGNLKRSDIKRKVRENILKRLNKIEKIIETNSNILEDAVCSKNPETLRDLENWGEEDKQRAVLRLKDHKFSWAEDIQKYIPTAEGYDYKKINEEQVKKIINEIIKNKVHK